MNTSGGQRPGLLRTDLLLLIVIAVASIAAVTGFRAVFVGWSFIVPAALGALGATVVVAVGWRFRLLIGEAIAASVVTFAVAGVFVAGPMPGRAAAGRLVDGVVRGWAEILSLIPPVDVTAELRVLPFALAWLGAALGGEVFRRTRAPGLPILGPLIALAVSVLVTDEERNIAIAQGVVLTMAALIVGFAQFWRSSPNTVALPAAETTDDASAIVHQVVSDTSQQRRARQRLFRAAVALVAVAVVAPLAGPRLPFANAYERFDLRDRNEPPWDPLSVPSPLVQIKPELKGDRQSEVVFTVQADEPVTRVQLATLGDYNGIVWTPGSTDDSDAISEFRAVGRRLPEGPVELDDPGQQRSATITLGELDGPWLPRPAGWPVAANFSNSAEPAVGGTGSDLRMNLSTGTLALPSGTRSGLEYRIDYLDTVRLDDTALLDAEIVPLLPTDEDDLAPPQIQNIAADIIEGVDRGWPQVIALRDAFVEDGFYDTSPQSRPGHSLFRVTQFLDDPEQLIGYEEQYAASAAIIARSAQLPARLVVGYLIPEDRYDASGRAEVVADDISAWIEVDLGPRGWIPVDVTPDRSREPVDETSGRTVEDVATPSPPPPPQIPPQLDILASEEEPEEEPDEDEDEDEDETAAVGVTLLTASLIGGGSVLGLVVLAAAAVVLVKAMRRRRRRRVTDPAERVGNAWREVLDRCHEAGLALPDRSTPGEVVRTYALSDLSDADEAGELRQLAAVVDRAAYHAASPEQPQGDAAWDYHDHVVANVYQHRSRLQRVRMRLDPTTLRRHSWAPQDNHR